MNPENKKPPQTKRRVLYDDERSNFRAVTEGDEGQQVRHIRGYALLFGVVGKPWRNSQWTEKIDKDALVGVDLSNVVSLVDHITTWVLGKNGKNMNISVDEIGLFVDIELGNTFIDDYIYDRVQREIMDGMSFHFDSSAIVAIDYTNKLEVIVKINAIYEVSVLAFPAYEETLIITMDGEDPAADLVLVPEEEALKTALLNLIDQI